MDEEYDKCQQVYSSGEFSNFEGEFFVDARMFVSNTPFVSKWKTISDVVSGWAHSFVTAKLPGSCRKPQTA